MTARMLSLALAACLAAGASAQAKTLVYCSEGSPENFNPMLNTTGTTFDASRPVYNRLVQFKLGSTETEPGLAEKWDISPDGKVFTFHLRHNVKWHSNANFKPTRPFNADDVLFSFERQWKDRTTRITTRFRAAVHDYRSTSLGMTDASSKDNPDKVDD